MLYSSFPARAVLCVYERERISIAKKANNPFGECSQVKGGKRNAKDQGMLSFQLGCKEGERGSTLRKEEVAVP